MTDKPSIFSRTKRHCTLSDIPSHADKGELVRALRRVLGNENGQHVEAVWDVRREQTKTHAPEAEEDLVRDR